VLPPNARDHLRAMSGAAFRLVAKAATDKARQRASRHWRSCATSPITRPLSAVRHRDDTDYVAVHSIDESKWKAAHRNSSMSSVDWFADIRGSAEEFRNALRFHHELGAKACTTLFTEVHRRRELLLRCGVKLSLHFLIWPRRRANTSSAGTL
jgi:hypothetical protein